MKTLEYSQLTNGTSKYYLSLKKKRVASLDETLFLVFDQTILQLQLPPQPHLTDLKALAQPHWFA